MCLPDFCLLLAKPSWKPADLGQGAPAAVSSPPLSKAGEGRSGAEGSRPGHACPWSPLCHVQARGSCFGCAKPLVRGEGGAVPWAFVDSLTLPRGESAFERERESLYSLNSCPCFPLGEFIHLATPPHQAPRESCVPVFCLPLPIPLPPVSGFLCQRTLTQTTHQRS